MAYIEISNLPETLNLNDESVFPVVYQGETRKVKFNSMAKIFNYFTSISYNKTTGVYTFTRVDGTSALLSTDLQKSFKDVSLSNGIITFTAHSGETKTIDISIPDNSITLTKLVQELQTKINSIDNKVDKVVGKGLSTNDFTNELKTKLEGLENYDDTEITEQIEELQAENDQLWNDHPDILDNNAFPSGTDLTLQDTGDLKMKVDVGGNSTQGSLPNEYQQVEYIESSGTQYIDTGVKANTSKKVKTKVNWYSVTATDSTFIGATSGSGTAIAYINGWILSGVNVFQFAYGGYDNVGGLNINTDYEVETTLINGQQTFKANNIKKTSDRTPGVVTSNNLYMFAINSNNEARYFCIGKMYYCQIYDTNDVLTRNYIPCYRKSDNVIGMYDLVTNTFFTNQGTGTFTKGNDIPNPTYKQDINNVEGDVVVISKNSDNTKSNTVTFPLSQGQKLMLGDTLEDDGIHHKRGQIDLSTITFSVYATNKYRTNRLQNIIKKPVNDYVVGEIIAEKYLPVSNDTSFVNGNIAVDRFGTINLYDTTGTPSGILEYALAEETIEAYTSAQQTAYNKLKEMQSYYDLTYVVGSSNNAQPILTAHAKKSIKELSGGDLSNYQTKITSTNKLNSDLVNDTNQTNKFVTTSEKNTWNAKQNTTDNNLATTNKNITSAINEVNSIAKGANQALSYASYSAMITAFNSASSTDYNVGQNIYIETLEVPDLWVYKVESTSSSYTYTTDEAITTALETTGYIQVGYYKLSALETQKVDLTNYVENTDYANATTGGVVKISILTQSEYDALQTIDTNTFYMIKEEVLE